MVIATKVLEVIERNSGNGWPRRRGGVRAQVFEMVNVDAEAVGLPARKKR
ncbi:MAG: hypothetical protein OEW00_10735 [candidate division Zixibacteria bacterium]|nr:hypothetical protein [candidate division Zixibacteria bacterium]